MTLHQPAPQVDEEAALAARAAWLHFAGGKTQGEVAELLGVQSTKAHRLIARARADGLIRVFVEGPISGCIALEEKLKADYGLAFCEVVPNIDEGSLPLRTLGMAGARYLRNLIESAKYRMIGMGHGRTLATAVDLMPSVAANGTRFVSLLGGLTRRFAASPFDVIHRLAERTAAEAYVMPVPFFANTEKDRQVLEAQYGVSDVIAMAKEAELYIAGIGEVDRKSFIATAGMVDEEDVEEVMKTGACAELLGHFFNEHGEHLPNSVSARAMAPRFADLKSHRIVALAGGTSKTRAIRAILAHGLLFGLITDEATAKRLVSLKPGREPGKKNGKPAPG
ncbi:sugar-binding transcriptional regulator [Aestuariivirga litoralis]|uniref:Sugar-binding transcriptional regulator n=1 Tax=Aestuariivirga litoralis TaxID=2650924 RepID=A0A2W2BSS6_9HYPH|nr:sugar-binding domain-containing protein [Aestuariivirga litoralis]PZF76496.1 sugar-binding transcriptional regulator [Aestuariivirga litoralis]